MLTKFGAGTPPRRATVAAIISYDMNLKLLSYVAIFIFLSLTLNAQTTQKEAKLLSWTNSRSLTFSDFQGKPGVADTALQEASAKAATHKLGEIVKSIKVHFVSARGKTTFTIHAAMKKDESWIKNSNDTITLRHEQGHFDICEIYARTLRRDIGKAKSLSEAKVLFNKTVAAEEREQDAYDSVNTYRLGGITEAWETKISNRLKALERYQNPVVVVAIGK